ncbi:T-complex protein subunit theta [Fasciola hepatica]|uniref:T-complex protein 1 subunit theta n=1 Tax=Fasciola hepatica TaxID=6192 RepID=A0A4E0RZX0_FASHE|nr:T-complex protein subunit theta [Fasciola hepatica]
MALHVPKAPGFMSMLKDGARYFEGLEEAVFRNIEACLALSKTTRSTMGPSGQNKIVINHIGKQFITNDAATILKELEVAHPAAKILVMASQQQEQEAGDGTNIVFQLAGSLLEQARDLLRMMVGLWHHAYVSELVVESISDLRNHESVKKVIRTSIMSKQVELADFLSDLITKACISILPQKSHFNVDNVRVLKVLGAGVNSSRIVRGMVFRRESEGEVKEAKDCKIAIFSCPIDTLQTETKGTVLLTTADELTQFSKGEESLMEKHMKAIADAGVRVVVSGGKVGELALHYANKLGLMVVRLSSKFDIRRLCQATGAVALPRLTAPSPEELGHVTHVRTDEIADANVVIFEQDVHEGSVVTILVRGSTENIMDDVERAIDDGVNTFKCLTRSPKLVAGAGATEIELARRLLEYADTLTGLEQYAVREFARSFEVVVRALAENTGEKATEIIAMLYAKHLSGETHTGLITKPGGEIEVNDAVKFNILDLHMVKRWAIKFATDAACTVLRVDQIIMARPAGGPKPRQPGAPDED